MGISFFRGRLCGPFFWSVFPKYFSRIGSNVCDVYVQNIRLSKVSVLNIQITYFWPDPEKMFGKNTSKKRPAKPPPLKKEIPVYIFMKKSSFFEKFWNFRILKIFLKKVEFSKNYQISNSSKNFAFSAINKPKKLQRGF